MGKPEERVGPETEPFGLGLGLGLGFGLVGVGGGTGRFLRVMLELKPLRALQVTMARLGLEGEGDPTQNMLSKG